MEEFALEEGRTMLQVCCNKDNLFKCLIIIICTQNSDEENKIDFVIVWEEKHSDPLWSDKKYKRKIVNPQVMVLIKI